MFRLSAFGSRSSAGVALSPRLVTAKAPPLAAGGAFTKGPFGRMIETYLYIAFTPVQLGLSVAVGSKQSFAAPGVAQATT